MVSTRANAQRKSGRAGGGRKIDYSVDKYKHLFEDESDGESAKDDQDNSHEYNPRVQDDVDDGKNVAPSIFKRHIKREKSADREKFHDIRGPEDLKHKRPDPPEQPRHVVPQAQAPNVPQAPFTSYGGTSSGLMSPGLGAPLPSAAQQQSQPGTNAAPGAVYGNALPFNHNHNSSIHANNQHNNGQRSASSLPQFPNQTRFYPAGKSGMYQSIETSYYLFFRLLFLHLVFLAFNCISNHIQGTLAAPKNKYKPYLQNWNSDHPRKRSNMSANEKRKEINSPSIASDPKKPRTTGTVSLGSPIVGQQQQQQPASLSLPHHGVNNANSQKGGTGLDFKKNVLLDPGASLSSNSGYHPFQPENNYHSPIPDHLTLRTNVSSPKGFPQANMQTQAQTQMPIQAPVNATTNAHYGHGYGTDSNDMPGYHVPVSQPPQIPSNLDPQLFQQDNLNTLNSFLQTPRTPTQLKNEKSTDAERSQGYGDPPTTTTSDNIGSYPTSAAQGFNRLPTQTQSQPQAQLQSQTPGSELLPRPHGIARVNEFPQSSAHPQLRLLPNAPPPGPNGYGYPVGSTGGYPISTHNFRLPSVSHIDFWGVNDRMEQEQHQQQSEEQHNDYGFSSFSDAASHFLLSSPIDFNGGSDDAGPRYVNPADLSISTSGGSYGQGQDQGSSHGFTMHNGLDLPPKNFSYHNQPSLANASNADSLSSFGSGNGNASASSSNPNHGTASSPASASSTHRFPRDMATIFRPATMTEIKKVVDSPIAMQTPPRFKYMVMQLYLAYEMARAETAGPFMIERLWLVKVDVSRPKEVCTRVEGQWHDTAPLGAGWYHLGKKLGTSRIMGHDMMTLLDEHHKQLATKKPQQQPGGANPFPPSSS